MKISIILLLLPFFAFAQLPTTGGPAPDIEWLRFYGGSGAEPARGWANNTNFMPITQICITPDGGYLFGAGTPVFTSVLRATRGIPPHLFSHHNQKNTMKQIFFFIFALTSIAKTYAQCPTGTYIAECTLQYKYDNAGNRIERSLKQACTCVTTPPGGGGGGGTGRYAGTPPTSENSATDVTASLEISSIRPNPTTGGVTVQFSGTLQKGSIVITDATGKLLSKQAVSGTYWDIDLSPYASGMYYLTLRTDSTVQTYKVGCSE